MNLRLCMRYKLVLAVTFASFFCAVFIFTPEAYANGNIYADGPPPEAVPPSRGTVRRAPVRRPAAQPTRREPAETEPVRIEPQLPSSLQIGIIMMEQGR